MLEQIENHIERTCGYIGSRFGTTDNMQRVANGSCEHLRFIIIVAVYFYNLFNQLDSVFINIIQPADEWRYISSACFGCENCLSCRKHKRAIGSDSFS